jgi:hypothetical protein
MIEAVHASETSVNFEIITWRNILEIVTMRTSNPDRGIGFKDTFILLLLLPPE